MTTILVACIKWYQKIFSPDHGRFFAYAPARHCRFFPSCSEYTAQALGQYGLLAGIMVSLKRLARCHPFSAGGYDPIIKATKPFVVPSLGRNARLRARHVSPGVMENQPN